MIKRMKQVKNESCEHHKVPGGVFGNPGRELHVECPTALQ